MINVLHLGLSYACNMHCSHCFVDKAKDFLTIEQIKKTITELVANHGLFIVYYTYGEPLVSSKFKEITAFCKELNLVQVLMTNGSILNESVLHTIQNNISTVYVSLDSTNPSIHDANRNFAGAFETALKTISTLVDCNIPVGISMTVTEHNHNEVSQMYDLARSLHVNTLSVLRERKNGQLIHLPSNSNYFSFLKDHLSLMDGTSIKPSIMFHDPHVSPLLGNLLRAHSISKQSYEKYIEMTKCHANCTLSLMPNGDVSHCNLSGGIIGNINKDDISFILKGDSEPDENSIYCAPFSRKSE